ncbi:MAG: PASTA domain-containing protein [Candidatus Hydrogenedentes bacterium]|nr:PASTA domain-containing protein [Candidatus Hydrogenedentota bacterium]
MIMFILVMAGAGYYTYNFALKGGGHVTVPNIVDRPVTEAALLLTERNLELGHQVQAAHPTIPKFYVIAQRPAAGRIAREGRRINVVVSRGQDFLRTPDLSGKSLEDARREILAARFRVGSLARIPAELPRDLVISQDPPAGGELPDQGEIHLLVSAGSDRPSALMPDLRGLLISEIEKALANFDVSLVPNEVDIPGATPDVVLAQTPAPDTLIYENQIIVYDYVPSITEERIAIRFEATVRHQMFYDWYNREVRVDVVDRMGSRQKVWSKLPEHDDAARSTYISGTAIRVPVIYIDEANVEIYIDGNLEASYLLQDGNPPIKTR